MKFKILTLSGLLTLLSLTSDAQGPQKIDLEEAAQNKTMQVINRDLTLLSEKSNQGIRLSKAFGEGIARLKDIEFSNGTIEFDVRGENVMQHSFVGIAFHGQNDSTYDAIYLRPFHFLATDSVSKSRMIQYVSLPVFTWRKLRGEFPGKYENEVEQVLDPNGWVHVRVMVKDNTISTFINGSQLPSLVVEKITPSRTGWIGFYVADTSGGDFANLIVNREP